MINTFMRIIDLFEKDMFGVRTPSPQIVAKKHGVPIEDIMRELRTGIQIEKEHTRNNRMAKEIALDHLAELPDYYTRLKKMEKGQH